MGATSGTITGALLRHASSRFGVYLVGFVAGMPIVLGIMIQNDGMPSRWTLEQKLLSPVLAIVASLVIGSEILRRRETSGR
jgi:hypothetical protein